jgi:lipoate-protein ligase A
LFDFFKASERRSAMETENHGQALPNQLADSLPTLGFTRIVVDPRPSSGSWNMAVDATLLESAVRDQVCTLRFYRWQEPTLSLGYFQTIADLPSGSILSQLPVVRRLSGGGAIVHHHELTYSCAVPATNPLSRDPYFLYTLVHETVIGYLGEIGVSASFRGTTRPEKSSEFQCFARGDSFDVVCDGHKVLGSAQRRRKGAVLQHGSLILAQSRFAPQFIGLSEIAGREISAAELLSELPTVLGRRLGTTVKRTLLTAAEFSRTQTLSAANASSQPPRVI